MTTKKTLLCGALALAAAAALYAQFAIAAGKTPKRSQTANRRTSVKYGFASGADQVLSAVYDSSTNALRVEGGSGGGGASVSLQTNGAANGSQSVLNLENGSDIALANTAGTGNVTISFAGILPSTQAAAVHTWLSGYNSATGAFTASQPSFLDLSGSLSDAQLPAGIPLFSGAVTAGDCTKWSSSGVLADAGAPCGSGGSATAIQVNGANTASQSPINFQSGGYITVSNPSAGNIQFNFSGPLAAANGGTGLTALGTSGQCLGTNGTSMVWQSCGSSGSGTVTSVGLSLPSALFTVSGSPVTASGTLTGALAAQNANLIFAGPSGGSAAAPAFRALTDSDLPSISFSMLTGTALDSQLAGSYSGTGACAAHEWASTLSRDAAPTCTQPAYSDILGTPNLYYQTVDSNGAAETQRPALNLIPGANMTVSCADNAGSSRTDCTFSASASSGMTNPMTTLGDIIYENATPAPARLGGNTTSTLNVLTQTGTGAVSAAPAWNTLAGINVPVQTGAITAGDCVEWSSPTAITDAGSACVPPTPVVTYTASQTLTASQSGSVIKMNCSAACTLTLPTSPVQGTNFSITSVGSTVAALALGGTDKYNGGSSVPVLGISFITAIADGSGNWLGTTPLVAGSGVTVTNNSNSAVVAASATASFFQLPYNYGLGAQAFGSNATVCYPFQVQSAVALTHISFYLSTADSVTTDFYDVGIYGPGTSGQSNVPLVADFAGATDGINLNIATGLVDKTVTQSSVTLNAGVWYAACLTGSAATAAYTVDSSAVHVMPFAGTISGATTSNGKLNATINFPTFSFTTNADISFAVHN